MATVVLNPVQDTYEDTAAPNTVMGAKEYIIVGENDQSGPLVEIGDGGACLGLMRFDLSSIPTGSTIVSANLQLNIFYCKDDYMSDLLEIYRLLNITWLESVVTYNNRPSISGRTYITTLDNGGASGSGFPQPIDLTSHVQAVLSTAGITLWFNLYGGTGQAQINFSSKEDSADPAYHPTLTIVYTPPPTTELAAGEYGALEMH